MATVAEMKAAQDVDGLIAALKDTEWQVRLQAAEALGELRAEKAVDSLLAARKDENANMRWTAVWALGEIGGESVLQALISSLEDESEDVRSAALRVLQQSDDPRAQEAVRQAIPVQRPPVVRLTRLLRYLTFAVGGLAVVFLVVGFYLKLRGQILAIVFGSLVVAAFVMWQAGGRKG